MRYIFPLLLSALIASQSFGGDNSFKDYSHLILGKWFGPRKIEIYYPDGTWGIQRNPERPIDKEGRYWKIAENKITLIFPGDKGAESAIETITKLDQSEFVTSDGGYSLIRTRTSNYK